jgi:hypothetical protein
MAVWYRSFQVLTAHTRKSLRYLMLLGSAQILFTIMRYGEQSHVELKLSYRRYQQPVFPHRHQRSGLLCFRISSRRNKFPHPHLATTGQITSLSLVRTCRLRPQWPNTASSNTFFASRVGWRIMARQPRTTDHTTSFNPKQRSSNA